jgi:molybdate transport system substrate-binding protein
MLGRSARRRGGKVARRVSRDAGGLTGGRRPFRGRPRPLRAAPALIGAVLLFLFACAPREKKEIAVFAAASLGDAFRAIADSFETEGSGGSVLLNFAASHTLATQILEGAGADVFVSADSAQMGRLVEAGLVDSPFIFARNRLVLLVPEGNPAGIRSMTDLEREGVRVVLAVRSAPIGAYTEKLLERLGLAEAVSRNVVSYEESVSDVAGKVLLGEVDAGVVYATDAAAAARSGALSIEIPEAAGMRVACYGAILAATPRRAEADRFVRFLRAETAARVLAARGFLEP